MDKEIYDSQNAGDFSCSTDYAYDAGYGLTHATIDYISDTKGEEQWLREFRHEALDVFFSKNLPKWFNHSDVIDTDFDKIKYYLANGKKVQRTWDDVPSEIRETFERLGVPENERKFLAGVEAQFDSEAAYSRMKDALLERGVIFVDSTVGLKEYSHIFRKFFATVVPVSDNKFSALNGAVFSGGSFIYVPAGVKIEQPLQAYFRINSENFGQFERTLIVVDEGAEVTYLEGCTAPRFDTPNLHSAVVELVALPSAKIQYITVQNWSNSVYNLVTKRAVAHSGADIRWIDCNIGSQLTVKYPAIILNGEHARGEVLSIAVASTGQHQDTGAKMIHLANNTYSNVMSKSISIRNGMATYRGLIKTAPQLSGCVNKTRCDALLLNGESKTATYPTIQAVGGKNKIEHEASVFRIDGEQIFYMMQRGICEKHAASLSVNGFINDLVREFPMEYSIELKRLIESEMENYVS
ncbi:MAG: Fe-S cluster assembly protein SufB [Puniceicoccales bacterium]|jgi:Fe-S cluster assembly protein SufB|nr:Fe-S cluster assembly protein SufB [Puniceicoccales bacterium]